MQKLLLIIASLSIMGCSHEPEFTNEYGVQFYTKKRCVKSHSEMVGAINTGPYTNSPIYNMVCDSFTLDTISIQ